MSSPNQLDILGFNAVSVKPDVVITLTKENVEGIDKEKKEKCKILKFSSEWKFDEILSTISGQEAQFYPNLFIFIIEEESFGFFESKGEKLPQKVEILKENLLKFNTNRSMILQLTSKDEEVTKFYYKGENSEDFQHIKEQTVESEDFVNFSTFLWLHLNDKVENLEDLMLKKLPNVENSSLVLRFLRTLKYSGHFFNKLVLKCAAEGSKSDLLAAIDGYIDGEGKLQGCKAEYYISSEFHHTSVLHSAINSSNQEIIKFLVEKCANLIQRLPFKHQIDISTTAYETNQTEVLCDLLEFCDFPFPRYLRPEIVNDQKLRGIIDIRKQFNADVLAENLSEIERFLKNNLTLKFAYNLDNESAFCNALNSQKFRSFTQIMETLCQILDEEQLRFILENKIFISVVCSAMDAKDMEKFIDNTANKIGPSIVSKALKMKDRNKENLFFNLIQSKFISIKKFKEILKIVEKFLDVNEITELMTACNRRGWNILHIHARYENTRPLVILFKVFGSYFNSVNHLRKFKKLIAQKASYDYRNVLHMAARWRNKESHQTLWRLLLNYFENREELKNLMLRQDANGRNCVHLLMTEGNASTIEFTFQKIQENFSDVQFKEVLNTKQFDGRNLLQRAAWDVKNIEIHKILWKIIRKYFNASRILGMIKQTDQNGYNFLVSVILKNTEEIITLAFQEMNSILRNDEKIRLVECLKDIYNSGKNIFHVLVEEKIDKQVKIVWEGLQNFFKFPNGLRQFQELVSQKTFTNNQNILHFAAYCDQINFHATLWKLLLKTFENREELKNLMLQEDKGGYSSVQLFVICDKPDVIEYMFKKIKKYFSCVQYEEILKSKGVVGRNLLQIAASNWTSQNIRTHRVLWKLFREFCKSDEEFLEILKEDDRYGSNVFHLAVAFSTSEIFEFMIKELEKITSHEEIRRILSTLDKSNRNLFQNAEAKQHESFKLHKLLWKIAQKYFDSSEIMDIMKHADEYGDNFLQNVIEEGTKEIVELTWNEIRKVLIADEYFKENLSELLNECSTHLAKVLENSLDEETREKFNKKWEELIHKFQRIDSYKLHEKISNQQISLTDFKVLHRMTYCDKMEFHGDLWKALLNHFEDKEQLKSLLLPKDVNGNSFVHLIMINCKSEDIIEFTFSQIQKSLSDVQYKDILKSKGQKEMNLLHLAAISSKDIKIHQILWKTFQDSFKTDEEFLEILKEVDQNGSNVFHLSAAYTSSEIFEFMIQQLEKIASDKEIKNLLTTSGFWNENILQTASTSNKSLGIHENLWRVIEKYFSSSEIVQLMNYCDKDSDNILHNAVIWNTKEIVELTWKQIQKFIAAREDQAEYLSSRGHEDKNLLQLSLDNQAEDPEVHHYVENLMSEYEIQLNN